MKGWLLETHVISVLASPSGEPSVKQWASTQPEHRMYLSVVALAEFDKRIHTLEPDHPDRSRHMAARDALAHRFSNRLLSIDDAIIYRSAAISGEVKRRTRKEPPVIDMLLAATAIEHDLFLVTRSLEAACYGGAAIFNPWNDDPDQFPLT